MFDFLDKAKVAIIGTIVIGSIAYFGFYIYGLKSTISDLQTDKLNYEVKLSEANKVIAIKEAKISVLEGSIKELEDKLNIQNKSIEIMKVNQSELNKTILTLQHQEPSIQYIVKKKTVDCKELEGLVKTISGLKYENF